MRLKEKLLTTLLLVPLGGTSAWAKERVNFDAFLVNHETKTLAASESELQSRGVRVGSVEERLGLPTVLWNDRHETERSSALAAQRPEQAARVHLQKFADLYRLTSEDISSASLQSVHNTRFGPIVARFEQKVGGIEVFRGGVNVVMDRQNNLVAITGYMAPHDSVAPRLRSAGTDFQLSAADAVSRAFKDLTDTTISARSLATLDTQGDYTRFSFEKGVSAVMPHAMSEPARAKKVYFTLANGLQPAFYVELAVGTKSGKDSEYYSFVISATDGALLFRNNQTADAAYSYRVWAGATDYIPFDGPQGNDATPHPTGTPNGYQAPFISPNLVTLQSFPYSRNDPWLPPNSTQTNGNNADAYVDVAAPDGYQPETDLRANTTAPGAFDYTYDVTKSPIDSANQRKAATAHLFYLNNFLHDWYYDYGFDEISGNAQKQNFGRGGLENDAIKAEAQDYLGRNNANMSTPSDGGRPRMQMYVFDGLPALKVLSPANLAGIKDAGSASFGALVYDVTGNVSILNANGITEGCTAFAAGTFTGKIAVIDRGTCNFIIKAKNAQVAGAIAVIIANNVAGASAPGMSGADATITVPTLSITKEEADAWKTEVRTNGTTISANLKKTADLDRDGTIDNNIVAHEWGHYISNRLIGNSNGLVNNQGRSMGEGWGDFHAMLLSVRDEDRTKPGNNTFQGVYAMASYVMSGGANNGYYFGIRRVPYSTDFTKNALTFKHIANYTALPGTAPINSTLTGASNSEVHNSGEVWANMLWECYASLLNAYPFQEAQDRMKSYLIAAYKTTPNSPTFIEARDALLAVAAAADPADYTRFVNAFAKRGAGFGAKAPDRDSFDHVGVVESYANGNNIDVTDVRLDDSVTGCDVDGVLDVGETGLLTVTVRNTGLGALPAFTGTVAASGTTATLQFPNGNTLSFPAVGKGGTTKASVQVKLNAVTGATPRAGITVTLNESSLPASAKTLTYDERVHYDEAQTGSTIDSFDSKITSWTSTLVSGKPGWAQTTEKNADGSLNRYLHAVDQGVVSDVGLTTPWMQINPSGNTVVSFKYRHSLEWATVNGLPAYYDGVVLELTIDDLFWYDFYLDLGVNPGYTAFLELGDNPLGDRAAFVSTNPLFPAWNTASVNLGTLLDGLPVRFRFRIGSDSGVGGYGFDVDDFRVTNVSSGQFSNLIAETSDGTVCNRRPIADVGQSPRTYPEFDTNGNNTIVTLNGSASYDPDGQPLTYTWTQTAGDPVSLQGANTATPSFTADTPYDNTYAFQLVVNDGVENSLPVTAIVTVLNTNHAPVAVATAPATVPERSQPTITLDASASDDADGEELEYAWAQVENGAPTVVLSDPTAARPTFATPEVKQDTTFEFEVTVTDIYGDFDTASVSVTVTNVDRLPTANAGPDQTVDGRRLVVLPGGGSDPDGDAISYAWTQESGPPVTLSDANKATAYFTSPDVKTQSVVVLKLTITPATGASASDTVSITVRPDKAPNVNAGVDLFAKSGSSVTLYGSASDPENDTIAYAWTQDPTDANPVTLVGANTANPSFTAPTVTADAVLHFTLTATANGLSSTDTVTVTVQPGSTPTDHAPVVTAGPDQTVSAGITVTLGGFAADADGDAITYAWTQDAGDSTQVTLSAANVATPTFTAPNVDTVLHFTLTVTANGKTASDTVAITTHASSSPTDHDPVVTAGPDQTANAGTTVTLGGFAADADGDAITYAWTQNAGDSTQVTLSAANTAAPTFTAPNADTVLHFTLTVTANGKTASDTVAITTHASSSPTDHDPVVTAGPDQTANAGTTVTLGGFAADADGDTITYAWTQDAGDSTQVTLSAANTAAPTFTAPNADTVLHFTLTVTANGKTASDSVAITTHASSSPTDHAPVVTAGPDQTVSAGTTVTLGGFAADADGDAITYAWTQDAGDSTQVTLSAANAAAPTFTAPNADTVLHFTLTVTANGKTASDIVAITTHASNSSTDHAPVVTAGPDQTANSGTTVTLGGFAHDADGDSISYAWTQSASDSTQVSLSAANTAAPTFTAPNANTVLHFTLTVTANGKTASDSVAITVVSTSSPADHDPLVSAGSDQNVDTGDTVTLEGFAVDADGDAITYAWTQDAGDAHQVTLSATNVESPTFTAPNADAVLHFTLTVTANGKSVSDTVTVTVTADSGPTDHDPVVTAGPDQSVVSGTNVTLGGFAVDSDGDKIDYAWTQDASDSKKVTLSSSSASAPTFKAPDEDATLHFTLTITANGKTASDTVTIEVKKADDGGCASTGSSSGGAMLLALLAGVLLSRRRTTLG
ncbi:myxosortase-dependent M36 family metallopeptidase [Hyalangium versicolor]|uniref:myxosortase-dependent M36 family metallopeptidase n=1 Tax=Hyalangium versicolor TaxID=2861190 RepID=UPI001CCA96FE|nr:myxosortase-dependent M36 family metallopeptidase [Hyalangium versicolor]